MDISGSEPKTWLEKNTGNLLALLTVGGGLYVIAFCPDNKAAIIVPLVTFVLGFFFGTGIGSQAKDKIIAGLKGGGPPSPA